METNKIIELIKEWQKEYPQERACFCTFIQENNDDKDAPRVAAAVTGIAAKIIDSIVVQMAYGDGIKEILEEAIKVYSDFEKHRNKQNLS